MGYISLTAWRDLTDGHLYQAGEAFPFDGRKVSPDRVEGLLTAHNKAGCALIEPMPGEPEKEPETATKAQKEATEAEQETEKPKRATRKRK